jgi:hypothetical protein
MIMSGIRIILGTSYDLSAGSFEVINENADITAPTADLSTLSASPKVAYPGDTVTIKVKVA